MELTDGHAIVVDIGKTLSKVSLWSRAGECLAKVTRPNAVHPASPYTPLDTAGVADWLIATLAQFAGHPVEAIIPVAHGAAVAGIRDGEPAFVPPDYEWQPPASDYAVKRDAFAQTGSPMLPAGLNIGTQLHYLDGLGALDGVTLLPYAQYWAWLLSGVAASEVTSLGCHSDLWCPAAVDFSELAKRRGWAAQFAPLAKAGDALGTLRPDLAERTGLPPCTKIYTGLHDSNAALLAARGFTEIAGREATVLSTGTWFIAMRAGGNAGALPEGFDCLVNVDIHGQPVPTARWMGGREIEAQIELDTRRIDIRPDQPALLAAVPQVLAAGSMALPSFAPGFGSYPQFEGRWINQPEDWIVRRSATCLYAALVTASSLELIGTCETLLVEGRFAEAEVFVRALTSLRPGLAVYTANAHNDVSFGALRLLDPTLKPQGQLTRVQPLDHDITAYAKGWHEHLGEHA